MKPFQLDTMQHGVKLTLSLRLSPDEQRLHITLARTGEPLATIWYPFPPDAVSAAAIALAVAQSVFASRQALPPQLT